MSPIDVPPAMLDLVMPGSQVMFTYAGYGFCVVTLLVVISYSQRRRALLPLALLAGGGTLVLSEPIVDVLGKCWFPEVQQWSAFNALGRSIPQFLVTSYIWYVGGLGVYVFVRLKRGASIREIWLTYLVISLMDFFLEYPVNHMGMQVYYGRQPFVLLEMPMWFPVVNALMPILSGAAAFALESHLTGAKGLLGVVIPPIAGGAANGGCAWPVWVALNSDVGRGVTCIAALLSLGLACSVIWCVTILVRAVNRVPEATTR
jgi:hypothetical protein